MTRSAAIALAIALGVGAPAVAAEAPIPVQVARGGGDDALTVRLSDALEQAFDAAPDFARARGEPLGMLLVQIPTPAAGRREADGRTLLTATVRLTLSGRDLGAREISCPTDDLKACADIVVRAARRGLFAKRPAS